MSDRKRPFKHPEALAEAWRCLDCEDPPCTKACPAGIDVRGFIRKIRFENVHGAARRIREANVLGEICAWVCPVEELCEGSCKTTDISHPVAIARLQEYACRYGRETGFEPAEKPHEQRAERPAPVALVGAGPAGLACASELARMGYRPVVFEREKEAGGLTALEIPEDRLPDKVVELEVERVRQLGVEFRHGRGLGRDFGLDDLFAEGFEAVFVGTGFSRSVLSRTPADKGVELTPAGPFLAQCRRGPKPSLRGRVAVVGGGNTAMDASCAAIEAGAEEAYLLYRRSYQEMPAWSGEVERAIRCGVRILILVQPKEYRSVPEGVEVVLERTELDEAKPGWRPRPVRVPGSEFHMTFSTVIEAVGQELDPDALTAMKGVKVKKGRIKADPETWMTMREGVFAAGDAVSGGATVAQAVGEGRKAALGIHRYLSKSKV